MQLLFRELLRKAFHVAGSLIAIAYYFISKETAVALLSLINALLLLIEWLRLNNKISIPEILMRRHEGRHIAAYIYFQMAALISILVFDKTIAIAAILMLAVGDTASGLAGTMIKGGDVRNSSNRKGIKPFPIMVVIFLVCTVVGLVLINLPLAHDMTPVPFGVYVAGAFGATLGDTIPIRVMGRALDDNLVIPLLSGIFMTVAFAF